MSVLTRSGGIFDYEKRKVTIIEIQEKTQDPEFWNDPASAQKVMQDLDFEKEIVSKWDELDELRDSIRVYQQFLEEGEPVEDELSGEIDRFRKKLRDL
jgi:peptide chain release factor 2